MRYVYILFFSMMFFNPLYADSTILSLTPHYIYQFASHIYKKTSGKVYRIHIISKNREIKKEFQNVLKTKLVHNKNFFITQGDSFNIPKFTNMIYLSSKSKVSFKKLSDYVEGKSILLISFNEEDKKKVMINLLITDEKRLSFEINRANILNEGFSISDKIVLMGGTELDVAKLFKGAKKSLYKKELALQKSQKKLDEVYKQTELLQKRNAIKTLKLKATSREVKKLLKDMKRAKKLFDKQSVKNTEMKDKMLSISRLHEEMKQNFKRLSTEVKEKNKYIFEREDTLSDLNFNIQQKEQELKELSKISFSQGKQIKTQEGTIDKQEDILIITFAVIALFIVLIFVIVRMYYEQHRISRELKKTLKELKETQTELVQSAKMASLGELVSGLAHEMNTPIGVSITGISVLQSHNDTLKQKLEDKKLKESDLVSYFKLTAEMSDSINISLQRAAQLVRSFKQVSVDQQAEVMREFNLSEYLKIILVSLNSQFKHSHIKMHLYVNEDIVLTSYPGIYYQILTNLINNSFLHGFSEEEKGDIWIEAKVENDVLLLVYRDSGKGVSQKNLSHIFEPFFTTKRANGGTGLGLHIIYNLITQKLFGTITADSKENDGLSISMTLPLDIESSKVS